MYFHLVNGAVSLYKGTTMFLKGKPFLIEIDIVRVIVP